MHKTCLLNENLISSCEETSLGSVSGRMRTADKSCEADLAEAKAVS